MKDFFDTWKFKILIAIAVFLVGIMAYAGANGRLTAAPQELLSVAVAPFQRAAAAVSSGVASLWENYANIDAILEENQQLSEENASLRSQMVDYDKLKAENEAYKALANIQEQHPEMSYTSSFVIGRDPLDSFWGFTLDRGTLDGVAVNDAVISDEGYLLGVVREADLTSCKIMTILHPSFNAAGVVSRTRDNGIITGSADIAVFVSYGASKSASKHPELYGTGIPNGVAATESANNGCSGGAMIPLLSLGVPGDSVTAILLGAFIMKGITPGPMMYVTELPTVYRVFAALMLANLCMLVVGCLGVRFFAKIVSVEKKMLYPIILVISLLGAFSINKNAFDVGVCVAFGIIGWLMNKYEFPLSPILLALILGPMCEKNFVRYMNIQRGNFFAITTSPIAMVFATVAILVIVYSVYNQSKINKRAAANAAKENA